MKTKFYSFKSREIQKFTPQTLLNYVKAKGSFPRFIYNSAEDKMLSELNFLAQQYQQSLSLKDKAELLKHERKMLYEEIQNPELTLARYYPQIKKMKLSKEGKKNIEDYLMLCNLNAFSRINSLDKPFNSKLNAEEEENIIKTVSKKIHKSSPIEKQLKDSFKKIQEKYSAVLRSNRYLGNVQETLSKLDKNIDQPELLKDFLANAKLNKEEKAKIKELINNVLYSDNPNPEILRYAVWGAGKYRSDEAFTKIKEIALNKDEDDIRKREFAIHSVARYLREKTEEVHSIIKTVKNENSMFSPLARIIDDKINGNYYTKKDREFEYYSFNPKLKKDFKKFRDKFLILDKKPCIKDKNALDRNLIPFCFILDFLTENNFKFYIQQDTYTKLQPEEAGKRDFKQGLFNSGSFADSYDGYSDCANKYNIMRGGRIEDWTQYNVISHENGHTFHSLLGDEYITQILDLYILAIKENRILDYYSATNEVEYFAQGFEAFSSVYKPHRNLLDNDASDNTRYKLIAQDPALYNLIFELISFG